MPRPSLPTNLPRERAFLVGVEIRSMPQVLSVEDSLFELGSLVDTAGLDVVGSMTQRLNKPNSVTFIGKGKVQELGGFVEATVADAVIFDDELSPRHQRELERCLGQKVKLLDRTAVILDIFAQHAHTREGALQVELAQYEYRLPRLTRQWTHLARQAGGGAGRTGSIGGVGLHGPGETQLEVDRREIGRRIAHLKAELKKVRGHRLRQRIQRKRSEIPVVTLVGYTNAGKSTLLRGLTNAKVEVADQLFTTLDPTTRRVKLPEGQQVLLTDTVGFIHKLPTTLVAAFRATMEGIAESDLILHVVDVAHSNAREQARAVEDILGDMDLHGRPVVTAFNKIDEIPNQHVPEDLGFEYGDAVPISARTGMGFDLLLAQLGEKLESAMVDVELLIPYKHGHLIPFFHENGKADRVEHCEDGVIISGRLARRCLGKFVEYVK